jgi:hypothetical protein
MAGQSRIIAAAAIGASLVAAVRLGNPTLGLSSIRNSSSRCIAVG